MGALARHARAIARQNEQGLEAMFGRVVHLPADFGRPRRRRLFLPARVFWLFLQQVFSSDPTCREVVRTFLGWLALTAKRASGRTAGYCKARKRLRQEDLDQVEAPLTRAIRSDHLIGRLWYGRPVKVVDGSGLSMPDTPKNRALYPPPHTAAQRQKRSGGRTTRKRRMKRHGASRTKSARATRRRCSNPRKAQRPAKAPPRKRPCAFPVMRVVALFCLGTGLLLELARDSLAVGERRLFRSLWDTLLPDDVVLADRGFCGYGEFYHLRERGVDAVMRAHPCRTAGRRRVQRLGRHDEFVLWLKSKPGPTCPDKALWPSLPDAMLVREITFTVPIPGFRTDVVTVATTLLDPVAFPTEAFADLYRQRWQAELFLRDIKITLGMDILRGQSPEMIHKELTMHRIAYNLVRLTMLEAARQRNCPVTTLSFKGTLSTLRSWAPLFLFGSRSTRAALWRSLIDVIGRDPLPWRPNRIEPRARKRRPKNYQLLNKPRHQFKEILHRNRYSRTA